RGRRLAEQVVGQPPGNGPNPLPVEGRQPDDDHPLVRVVGDGREAGRRMAAGPHARVMRRPLPRSRAPPRTPTSAARDQSPAAPPLRPRGRTILVCMRARTTDRNPPRLTPHDERRVAVAAGCDPRTIRAYLDPARRQRMRSTVAGRIGDTLRALGL